MEITIGERSAALLVPETSHYFRHFFVYNMLHESVYNMDINRNYE